MKITSHRVRGYYRNALYKLLTCLLTYTYSLHLHKHWTYSRVPEYWLNWYHWSAVSYGLELCILSIATNQTFFELFQGHCWYVRLSVCLSLCLSVWLSYWWCCSALGFWQCFDLSLPINVFHCSTHIHCHQHVHWHFGFFHLTVPSIATHIHCHQHSFCRLMTEVFVNVVVFCWVC